MVTLPNIFTFFRLIAAFVFLFFGLQGRWDFAFPIFCAAAVTDFIDGAMARILRQRTQLGAFLDPTADKLLMFFSYVTLTIHRYIPFWLTALIIARDLLIVYGVALFRKRRIQVIYRPTYLSKVTTFFQIASVVAALVATQRFSASPFGIFVSRIYLSMLWITAGLTFATGVQYYKIGWRILHEPRAN